MHERLTDREPGSDLPLNDQLRFDAGSPALNLLATVGQRRSEHPVERLTSAGRLGDWLAGAGLPAVTVAPGDLASACDLREAGYRILAHEALPARAADVETLSAWSSRPVPGPRLLLVSGVLTAEETPATIARVLVGLARELVHLAIEGDRLRACDGPECGMLYLDASRGRRRRWCSMARCGNTAKVGRFRESAGAAQ